MQLSQMNNNNDFISEEDQLEEGDSTDTKKATKGHFFVVSLNAIHEIVKFCGLADDVMSYLVLARHTQGRGQWQQLVSTSGAKAIISGLIKKLIRVVTFGSVVCHTPISYRRHSLVYVVLHKL